MAEEYGIETFLPDDAANAELLEPDAALDDLAASLEQEGVDPDDVIVAVEEPPPIGRSWAFDFAERRFVVSGRQPLPTYGEATVLAWVEKVLHSDRGGSPIHPPEYGLAGSTDGIGFPHEAPELADLEDRIRDALLFHPRISDVEDFASEYDPDDEYLQVRFVVVLDDETRAPYEGAFGA